MGNRYGHVRLLAPLKVITQYSREQGVGSREQGAEGRQGGQGSNSGSTSHQPLATDLSKELHSTL
ncbi:MULTISPECIES: hypothetical protein [Cyanophyceae]|uniref:Uncharacterized protein n=1 Tax=Scytonema millei VB511283 TaxID=1245923 RepID=A0A9X5E940_9CYAN|nr:MULTISPECIES: hypothetical protein [Cyanophyceae]NHC37053.1 hypothetical protein [Scytonema millei VB511283]